MKNGNHKLGKGISNTPEYRAWRCMLARCENTINKGYKNYGGRGIKVCEEFHDFEKFYSYLGPRPSSKYSLERINNSRGYEIGNVTWDTYIVQNNNNRQTLIIDYLGTPMSLKAALRAAGDLVKYTTAKHRIQKAGWATLEAITVPSKYRSKCPEPDLGFPMTL